MQVGRYHVVGRLATGGMAEVLLGKMYGPEGFEQPVVLKRILPHLASEPLFRNMFVREARLAAHVRHPNVVRVFELMEEGQELFLVMEYLEGETAAELQRHVRGDQTKLPVGLGAFIVAEAAAGLYAAHEVTDLQGRPQRLVHRDVSPQNIFVTYGGEVKVIDFGIAKAADQMVKTSFATIKGKFTYMSPEQTRGEVLDQRSDIFSLGTVLYELTTLRRLFARANPTKTVDAICREPIVPPSELVPGYPPELERVCMKALERDPERRYESALSMRRDLLEALREFHPSAAPKEELASLMTELFSHRRDDKIEMLRSSHMDMTPAPVSAESAQAGESTEGDRTTKRESPSARQATPVTHDEGERTRRSRLFVATVALATSGVLLAWALHLARLPEVEREPTRPVSQERVTVTIDSTPSGADVWVGARHLGTTPLELESPSSGEAFDVELKKPGYAPKVVTVVPDANTELSVELVASGAGT